MRNRVLCFSLMMCCGKWQAARPGFERMFVTGSFIRRTWQSSRVHCALSCICNIVSYCWLACHSGHAATLVLVMCLFTEEVVWVEEKGIAKRLFLVYLKRQTKGWRNGSIGKSIYCYPRRPKLTPCSAPMMRSSRLHMIPAPGGPSISVHLRHADAKTPHTETQN